MKEVIRSIRFFVVVAIITCSLISLTFVGVVCIPQGVFDTSYNNVVQAKYDKLLNTKTKKIIIIGGSSAAFGISEDLLEQKTGYKVVNLGVHAGMGGLFNTEISKANIQKGDIVLLGYEYGWGEEDYFNHLGIDIVMSGIDSKIEMYRYIPLRNFDEIFGYLFPFMEKKLEYMNMPQPQGTYCRASFDKEGKMVLNRPEYVLQDYENNIDYWGEITENKLELSDTTIEYLKNYKEYVENKGADIFFISPPLLKRALHVEEEALQKMVQLEEQKIGIKYISNPVDYILADELMFDTIYHCNSKGELYRTELLVGEMKNIQKR